MYRMQRHYRLRRFFIPILVVFLIILTGFSTYHYQNYLFTRQKDLNYFIRSLQTVSSVNHKTYDKQFESINLPIHLTKSCQDYLSRTHENYLIIICHTGLGNRLQSIASAFLLAFLMNRRLLLHWPVTSLSGCQFHQLFRSPLSLSSSLLKSYTKEYIRDHSEYISFHGPFDELLCHSNLTLFKSKSKFLFLSTDEYFMSVLMKNPAYSQTLFANVNEDFLFKTIIHYVFQPTKELNDQIEYLSSKIGFCHKGIHMRKNGLKQIQSNGEHVFLG